MKDVIISTEAVNSYGSRVLTSGIDQSQYERNPVLLWMHRRSWEPGAMPIGKVENLRIEDGRLIGTPVFDQNDDFAKQIESKWENGFLRMASAGLETVETTPDPALVLPGTDARDRNAVKAGRGQHCGHRRQRRSPATVWSGGQAAETRRR